jgi:hypothetical protein
MLQISQVDIFEGRNILQPLREQFAEVVCTHHRSRTMYTKNGTGSLPSSLLRFDANGECRALDVLTIMRLLEITQAYLKQFGQSEGKPLSSLKPPGIVRTICKPQTGATCCKNSDLWRR